MTMRVEVWGKDAKSNPIRRLEVWGKDAKPNPLIDLFIHNLEEVNICDAKLVKLIPMWRNHRLGDEAISKRFDRILVSDKLWTEVEIFKYWVGQGCFLNYYPIFLQL
jgi:hypothetical protein